MTLTTAPNTGHQTFLYSKLATDLDRLDADIAFLGIPYGSAYSFPEIVNDQSNMPAAMRRASRRLLGRHDFAAFATHQGQNAPGSTVPRVQSNIAPGRNIATPEE